MVNRLIAMQVPNPAIRCKLFVFHGPRLTVSTVEGLVVQGLGLWLTPPVRRGIWAACWQGVCPLKRGNGSVRFRRGPLVFQVLDHHSGFLKERKINNCERGGFMLAPFKKQFNFNYMQNYVCGFYFDHKLQRVVLIWKQKPKWQAGKLNGVGGKIEQGESPLNAMVREFREETGILHNKWADLIILTGVDWRVYFFYAIGKVNEFEYAETQEAEEVAKIDIDRLDDYPQILNLRWLIPMAIYKHKFPEELMTFVNPASGQSGINHMFDPNNVQPASEATTEQVQAVEQEAQEQAMESAEEGGAEG